MPHAPRILYVITDLEVGGVPLHLLRLAAQVRDSGWLVTVVSLKPAGPVARRLANAGIELLSCEAKGLADWRIFDRLAGFIRDFSPDLVHAFLFHANLACRLVCLLGGFQSSRLICEIQTVEIERSWHLHVDRFTHWLCRVTIGNSPSVIRHLHERAAIPPDRLRLVPGGVDVDAIRSAIPLDRVSLGVTDDEVLLLWVGRMDPIKGLDTLVGAVDRLRREMPIKLLLAGDGDQRRHVEADIARRSLEKHVTLLGQRDDVYRLMKTADLFVFPSRTEGLPHVFLEAMAASLPVVTTDVPGCRDLITDGETGRLVPPDDPAALASAILNTHAAKSQTRSMSAKASHLVSTEYTLQRCCMRYLELYRTVLEDNPHA